MLRLPSPLRMPSSSAIDIGIRSRCRQLGSGRIARLAARSAATRLLRGPSYLSCAGGENECDVSVHLWRERGSDERGRGKCNELGDRVDEIGIFLSRIGYLRFLGYLGDRIYGAGGNK